jgi:hypothetical protein
MGNNKRIDMTTGRVLFFYQTFYTDNGEFISLDPIISANTVTDIHLSSIHFGIEADGQPYIHLNDFYPENTKFDAVWDTINKAAAAGIKISLMIGGAGGGFATLFQHYQVCYGLLKDMLIKQSVISGIDIDIEETVILSDVQKLIRDLKKDFPQLVISMAPLQSSLANDVPGMGGFVYRDLLNSPEGAAIDYFNGQFYGCSTTSAYKAVIENGYPATKVVMGITSGTDITNTVKLLKKEYPNFGGVYCWEYFNAVPSPQDWAAKMSSIINPVNDISTNGGCMVL